MKQKSCLLLLSIMVCISCIASAEPSKVKIAGGRGHWELLLNDKPFYIKGVGFGLSTWNPKRIERYMKEVELLGANAIRTWGISRTDAVLLDSARKYGIMVDLGIWLQQNGWMDYVNDEQGMQSTMNDIKRHVLQFKDHPALLMWNVGNEVIITLHSEKQKIAYAKYIDRVCKMIHEIDPNHPVLSSSAHVVSWPYFEKYAPNLDIYGTNAYGGAVTLHSYWMGEKISKPYVVTEFGAIGEWETQKDENGLEIEPNDNQKEFWYRDIYRDYIEKNKGENLGGFAFVLSDKDDFWLGLELAGRKHRPPFWSVREAFTGKKASNCPPVIDSFTIEKPDKITVRRKIRATVQTHDLENDDLVYYLRMFNKKLWSGLPKKWPLKVKDDKTIEFPAPMREGVYKVYFCVEDSSGNVCVCNTSIKVNK